MMTSVGTMLDCMQMPWNRNGGRPRDLHEFPCVQEQRLIQAGPFLGRTSPTTGTSEHIPCSMTGLQSSTEDRVAFYQAWDGAFAKRAFEEVARQATGLAAKRRNP